MAYTNIDDPSAHFHTQLYTGTGSSHSVTNDANAGNFKPDWVWIKERSSSGGHKLYDSTRGVQKTIQTQSTGAETTTAQGLTAFNTDGFTVGSDGGHNQSSATYVAWQWKANGGTTSSNTDGTLTGGATVQANTDAGFSIITYTGTSQTNPTVGHGLNQAPELVIVKNRDLSRNWAVGSTAVGWTKYLALDTTGAQVTNSGWWGNQDPTSTTVGLGTGTQTAGNTYDYVMYAFHSVQGYSKFGSYVGNGASDTKGTFIYTGFKPAFVITKRASSADNWALYDNKRDSFNVAENYLLPNTNDAEGTFENWDFVSNGFKSITGNSQGASGVTFLYMAFAENPFTTSTGIPTTAR